MTAPPGYPLMTSAAILPDIRLAASRTESFATCAYRAVVSTLLCPRSLPIIGWDCPSDISLSVNLLQSLYRSACFAVAEPTPCRKSPAMLAATRVAEALTESRSRCA